LNLFDKAYNLEIVEYIRRFNPDYKGINRKTVIDLIRAYKDKVELKVMKVIDVESMINFTTNGSDSRNGDRIVNFSINTANGQSFFIKNFSTIDNT